MPHFQIEMNEFPLYSYVEEIQDVVEQTLMHVASLNAAKSFILYRNKQAENVSEISLKSVLT